MVAQNGIFLCVEHAQWNAAVLFNTAALTTQLACVSVPEMQNASDSTR